MKPKTRNISLPAELDSQIEKRVRSGRYGNASDVVRAGLRALLREEMADSYRQFQEIMAELPRDPITPEIEQDVERLVKACRAADAKEGRPAGKARPEAPAGVSDSKAGPRRGERPPRTAEVPLKDSRGPGIERLQTAARTETGETAGTRKHAE